MVHVKHASLASRAMMAPKFKYAIPFWFETVAEQAIAALSILTLLCEESPVNWDSSGITYNRFVHTPKKHDKKYMKDY
jgi:hypothetical protein